MTGIGLHLLNGKLLFSRASIEELTIDWLASGGRVEKWSVSLAEQLIVLSARGCCQTCSYRIWTNCGRAISRSQCEWVLIYLSELFHPSGLIHDLLVLLLLNQILLIDLLINTLFTEPISWSGLKHELLIRIWWIMGTFERTVIQVLAQQASRLSQDGLFLGRYDVVASKSSLMFYVFVNNGFVSKLIMNWCIYNDFCGLDVNDTLGNYWRMLLRRSSLLRFILRHSSFWLVSFSWWPHTTIQHIKMWGALPTSLIDILDIWWITIIFVHQIVKISWLWTQWAAKIFQMLQWWYIRPSTKILHVIVNVWT